MMERIGTDHYSDGVTEIRLVRYVRKSAWEIHVLDRFVGFHAQRSGAFAMAGYEADGRPAAGSMIEAKS